MRLLDSRPDIGMLASVMVPRGGALEVRPPAAGWRARAARFAASPWAGFGFLFLTMLCLYGAPIPRYDESLYLLLPYKQFHPDFLANDWTFSQPWRTHLFFNMMVAPLTAVLPLEAIGWLGRFLCWSLAIVAIYKIGRQFRIPPPLVTLAAFLWIVNEDLRGQLGGDRLPDLFIARSCAYVLLLFAVNRFMQAKTNSGGVLLGLTIALHMIVGVWGSLAVGLALLFARFPFRKLAGTVFYAFLFASPCLAAVAPFLLQGTGSTLEDLRFMIQVHQSDVGDVFALPKREVFLAYLLLLFNGLHFLGNREDQAIRFAFFFQLALGLIYGAAFACRGLELYGLSTLFPHRLFPFFVQLFFFFHLMSAYRQRATARVRPALAFVGLMALLSLGNPVAAAVDQARTNYQLWTRPADDIRRCFAWIASNTPEDAVILAPPWRGDAYYFMRRAQVANWVHPPFDRLSAWRERIRALCGDVEGKDYSETWAEKIEPFYGRLSPEAIADIQSRFGGDYLVSKTDYPALTPVHASGAWRVYVLPRPQGAAPAAATNGGASP